MTQSWNTFELFETLPADFERSLNDAKNLCGANAEDSLAVKVAIVGFDRFSPRLEWSYQHSEFVANRLQGELSPQETSWHEECAEAITLFSCFALGALLGKFQSDGIDDVGFTLGDAHLAGFISLNDEEICALFS